MHTFVPHARRSLLRSLFVAGVLGTVALLDTACAATPELASTTPPTATAAPAAAASPTATASALRFTTVEGAGGVPLNVVSTGDPTRPAILLIHGLGQSYLSFERQLGSALARDWHLVTFDLRGHGNSGKPWDKASYQDRALWAEDVKRVIAATGLQRPLVVGWSYGTIVAMDYLRVAGPKSVAGLVLVGAYGGLTPPPDMSKAPPALVTARRMQLGANLADNYAAAQATVPMLTGRPMPPELIARQVAITLMLPRAAREGMFARPLDSRDLLPALRELPLLLQVGALDLGMPVKDGEALVKDWPGARLSVYEGVGHSPFIEAPERFDAELGAFAKDVLGAR